MRWRGVVRASSFRGWGPDVRGAGEGYCGFLDGADAAFLLPLRGVGFYPPRRGAGWDLVAADNLGDFDILAGAEGGGGTVRELLQDFLGGEVAAAVEELLVV